MQLYLIPVPLPFIVLQPTIIAIHVRISCNIIIKLQLFCSRRQNTKHPVITRGIQLVCGTVLFWVGCPDRIFAIGAIGESVIGYRRSVTSFNQDFIASKQIWQDPQR